MSDWDSGRPADGQRDTRRPSWLDGSTYPYPLPFPLAQALDDGETWSPDENWLAGEGTGPDETAPPDDSFAYERDEFDAPPTQPDLPPQEFNRPPRESYYPWPPAPYPVGPGSTRDTGEPGDSGGGRRDSGRRWVITAGIVAGTAAVGAAAVLLTGGHPGTQRAGGAVKPSVKASVAPSAGTAAAPSARPSTTGKTPANSSMSAGAKAGAGAGAGAALTTTQAQAVLASYTTGNNNANAQRSSTLLAAVESGSSFAIDSGLYLTQKAAGAAPYPAFSPVQATYYIPGNEPASGTRWFVVQVANAFAANPKKIASYEYLLFTQSAPGGAWQEAIEPYLVSPASGPRIQVGTDGLASAVSPDASTVAVAPGQLPAATADGQVSIANPGALADRADQILWQANVPGGTITDMHAAAAGAEGQEFALLTADGGALVFYTDTAKVTVTPQAGSVLHLTVPGLFSSQQALSQATVDYLEQFAAYDPPAAAGGTARVVADYSGITGKN